MTITKDASTPVLKTGATDPWVTASFTPPNNSFLVAIVMGDWFTSTPTLSCTSSGLIFQSRLKAGALDQGVVEIFTAEVGSNGGSARTVSADTTLSSNEGGVKVWVLTTDKRNLYVEAVGSGSSTTNNITPTVLKTLSDGAVVLAGAVEWQNLGAPASTDVEESFGPGGTISLMSVEKSPLATATAGNVTMNFDAAGTGTPQWTWAAISISDSRSDSSINLAGMGPY